MGGLHAQSKMYSDFKAEKEQMERMQDDRVKTLRLEHEDALTEVSAACGYLVCAARAACASFGPGSDGADKKTQRIIKNTQIPRPCTEPHGNTSQCIVSHNMPPH